MGFVGGWGAGRTAKALAIQTDSRARVESVAERVADEIEREDSEHDGEGGEDHHVRGVEEVGTGLVEHGAPAGSRCRDAESEETEGSFGEDRAGHADRGLHDERLDDIGQNVAQEEAEVRSAERAGGFDELALSHGENLRADQAGVADPPGDGECENQVSDARAHEGDERDREQDAGQGEEGVGDVNVEDGVGGSSVEAGEAAEQETNRERESDNGDSDGERDARAEEDAGKSVTAKFVGAERMGGRRSEHASVEIERGGTVPGEQRGKDGGEDEEQEQEDPGGGKWLTPDAAPQRSAFRFSHRTMISA